MFGKFSVNSFVSRQSKKIANMLYRWTATGGVTRELNKLEAAKKAKEEELAAKSRQYN